MKKAQKQEILEIIQSLNQAHEEIRMELNQHPIGSVENIQRVQTMLGECQEFAIAFGESIEKLEGKGHTVVAAIESYCESLYEIYMIIAKTDGKRVNGNDICNRLKKQLVEIEHHAVNDIIVKKEVVFLPYKAAMWDSMESFWMAARDDENCDVYVVAIPYYEKNSDQSLGKLCYEGNEYPEYVPITDWQKYNIEQRKPDIIFIQNPYDECNYITCVHPRYFSSELKKHTEMLVYLPYFVGTNDHVEEHFCTTPGVLNADRVMVQSETVKRIYIRSIKKFEKENHCKGRFGDLNKKISLSYNPKLERIRRVIDSGVIEVPEQWRNKVYQSSGKRKKIILYNTTVDALLKNSERYMDKLKSVLALFREEREIVLLWRPHPLLENAIKSMRPHLYGEYMDIVKAYREGDWGIFDETADIDRAIILSDAYYGDWSSVVEMYKLTKKPIMIQNCEV